MHAPEPQVAPRMQTYQLEEADGMTLFIALGEIREKQDPTLQFDFVCRAGICGSCAMNIDGTNKLACLTAIEDIRGAVKIYPLPHMAVVKDLVPDLSQAYAQLRSIEPWLKSDTPPPPCTCKAQSMTWQAIVGADAVLFLHDLTRLHDPAYDAEAVGRANARSRPEMADTAWITFTNRAAGDRPVKPVQVKKVTVTGY